MIPILFIIKELATIVLTIVGYETGKYGIKKHKEKKSREMQVEETEVNIEELKEK